MLQKYRRAFQNTIQNCFVTFLGCHVTASFCELRLNNHKGNFISLTNAARRILLTEISDSSAILFLEPYNRNTKSKHHTDSDV